MISDCKSFSDFELYLLLTRPIFGEMSKLTVHLLIFILFLMTLVGGDEHNHIVSMIIFSCLYFSKSVVLSSLFSMKTMKKLSYGSTRLVHITTDRKHTSTSLYHFVVDRKLPSVTIMKL